MALSTLDKYHDGMTAWLKNKFTWLESVDSYPELKTPLPTPCAFVSVVGWEPDESQPGNGEFSALMHGEVLLVMGVENAFNQKDVRNAAMAVCAAIQNTNFDLPIGAAKVVSANVDATEPELDPYVVWSVAFVQRVTVGQSAFEPEEARGGIRVAINPVDDSDANEYRPLKELANA